MMVSKCLRLLGLGTDTAYDAQVKVLLKERGRENRRKRKDI